MLTLYKYFYSENDYFENLCFSGGGVKGLAYVGVVKALQEKGLLKNVKRIIGSSAGAIFATTLACKITPADMYEEITTCDFKKFLDTNNPIVKAYDLSRELGMYSGNYFYNWIGYILEKYVGNSNITFKDAYDKFKVNLVITATDLTDKKIIYMNYESTPDTRIRDAVRMSMSIPLFFMPVKKLIDTTEHIFVDGGCLNNFPIDYFKDSKRTLGFNLDSNPQKMEINNVFDLLHDLINTMIEINEDQRIKSVKNKNIVNINTFDIPSTNFGINLNDINRLVDSGYECTIDYLK